MRTLLDPFSFLVVSLSGWMNQRQQHVIHYLMEENRVLREQIGNRRMRFSDDQRRRLAVRAKAISRKLLQEIAAISKRWSEPRRFRLGFAEDLENRIGDPGRIF